MTTNMKAVKRFRSICHLLLSLIILGGLLSGCATRSNNPDMGSLIQPNFKPGDTISPSKFVAIVSIVKSHPVVDARTLQIEELKELDFDRYIDVSNQLHGNGNLQVFAAELSPGTYRLKRMFDPFVYGAGYQTSYSMPFSDEFGSFSGEAGDVLLLGTVYLKEHGPYVYSAKTPASDLPMQQRLISGLYPGLDASKIRFGWNNSSESDHDSHAEDSLLSLIRQDTLGMHSPFMLSDNSIAVGTNSGTIHVYNSQGTLSRILDSGITSGPILAIAEPEPLTLVVAGGAEIKKLDVRSGQWSNIEHNLPAGIIEDFHETDQGYLAVVRGFQQLFVVKGGFGESWEVVAVENIGPFRFSNRTGYHSSEGVWVPEITVRDSYLVNGVLHSYLGGETGLKVNLSTGESSTFKFPSIIKSFTLDEQGVVGAKCALGFLDSWYSSRYCTFDQVLNEWVKNPQRIADDSYLLDSVVLASGKQLYAVGKTHSAGKVPERNTTELWLDSYETSEPTVVHTTDGSLRYVSQFQQGLGIYMTDHTTKLEFSLDEGQTWTELKARE